VASTQYCTDGTDSCAPSISGASVAVSCSAGSVCQTNVRYRSTDNVGNIEAVKSALVRIDKGAPASGAIAINNGAASTSSLIVTINSLTATDTGSGLSEMRFSNDNLTWSAWESYAATKSNWDLSLFGGNTSNGIKTVYVQYRDVVGNPSASFSDTISYQPPIGDIAIGRPSVVEGNSGTVNAVFTVLLASSITLDVSVTFATADGTATAGSDYIATSGILVIPAGADFGTITVPVIGDLSPEPNETFFVNLTNPINAVIVTGQGVGTIVNDDVVDTQPDAFTFTPQTGVALNTTVTSDTFTVSGINAAAAISITAGGSYSVNGGAFTMVSGTVTNGNTVAVRLTSSGSYSTQTCATLTIGGVQGSFCATTQGAPALLYVDPAHTCGGNTPCYSSIQEAINAAGDGTTIKVAQGTYHENVFIYTSATLTLEGGWASNFSTRASNPALTIIDGDLTGDGVGEGRVLEIVAVTGVAINVTVDRFTMQNGSANDGGGVFAWASGGGSLDLNLTRNIIKNNQTTNSGAGVGVYALDTGTTAHATLTNNMIFGNESGGNGGGVYAFADNSAHMTVILTNDTISDNTAVGVGGGMRAYSSHGSVNDVTVKNSIIWGNSASSGHDIAIRQSLGGNATVHSSFNDVGDVLPDPDAPGTYDDQGDNIDANPLFANVSLGDLHLSFGSPAKNAGTNIGAPGEDFEGEARPHGFYYDIGADERIDPSPGGGLGIGTITLRSGELGFGYGYGLEILGGQAPYSIVVTKGALPTGLV